MQSQSPPGQAASDAKVLQRLFDRAAARYGRKRTVIQLPYKVSDAILEVAEPLLSMAEDDAGKKTAVQIGVIGWNLALFPTEARIRRIEYVARHLSDDRMSYDVVRVVLLDLIRRKLELFPDINQFVLEFEITGAGDNYAVQRGFYDSGLDEGMSVAQGRPLQLMGYACLVSARLLDICSCLLLHGRRGGWPENEGTYCVPQ